MQSTGFSLLIFFRLIYLDVDTGTEVQHQIPSPELHLLMGGVNILGDILVEVSQNLSPWCSRNSILRHGYQGKQFSLFEDYIYI